MTGNTDRAASPSIHYFANSALKLSEILRSADAS